MSKYKVHTRKGFTLVELLFSIAILGFMLTITLSTFIGVFRFYNWSKTTRTTQQSARDTLDIITREVRSGKVFTINSDKLCINRTDGFIINGQLVGSERIDLNDTQQFQIKYFKDADCPGSSATPLDTVAISSPNVKVTDLVFRSVLGPEFTTNPSTPATRSVIVFFNVINGTPVSGECAPGDNFCDKAAFTTAVMER